MLKDLYRIQVKAHALFVDRPAESLRLHARRSGDRD